MLRMTRLRFWLIGKLLSTKERTSSAHKPYGWIHTNVTVGADDRNIVSGTRTSLDPVRDLQVMEAALELVQAIRKRGVDITPDCLYENLVGEPYPIEKRIVSVTTKEQIGDMSVTKRTEYK